jgi:hypothetical protein
VDGWELAERFAAAARSAAEPPDAGLVSALAAAADEEVRLALLDDLHALSSQPGQARRYAQHLSAVAAATPGPARAQLDAGIDLALAHVAAGEGDRVDAVRRLTRIAGAVEDHLPGLEGVRLALLGDCADADGDRDRARALWTRAQRRLVDDEQWSEASDVCVSLAQYAATDGLIEDAVNAAGAAADCASHADEPEQARFVAECAAELVTTAVQGFAVGDEPRAHRLCRAAHDLAVRHAATGPAVADLACCLGLYTAAAGRPDEAAAHFVAARAAHRAVAADAAFVQARLAWVDMCEARSLLARGASRAAEPLLHAAIRGYRAVEMSDAVRQCEAMLTSVLAQSEPDLERAAAVAADRAWPNVESQALAQLIDAFNTAGQGRIAEGAAALTRVRDAVAAAGNPHQAVGLEALAAAMLLAAGDPAPARQAVTAVEAHLAGGADAHAEGRQVLVLLRSLLAAELAGRDGDHRGQAGMLAALVDDLVAFGARHLAARIALRRARVLFAGGEPRAALDAALPAVLALDAVRFTLPDADRRRRWVPVIADGLDTTFRAALACGAHRVVAELLETIRGNAMPQPAAEDGFDLLAVLALPTVPDAGAPGTRPGAATLGGDERRTVLAMPARLRAPWGADCLADALERARRYQDPVRATVRVGWRVDQRAVDAEPSWPTMALGALEEQCAACDEPAADASAAALRRLADGLSPRRRTALLAAVDIHLAWLHAHSDRWSEAAGFVARAADQMADLPPALVDRWELAAGEVAEHAGRLAEARERWRRARARSIADGRWLDAGYASTLLVDLADATAEEALADCREAVALFVASGQLETAAVSVELAAALYQEHRVELGPGEALRTAALAKSARDLALARGRAAAAADLGRHELTLLAHSDLPWADLRPRFAAIRDELHAASDPTDNRRQSLAQLAAAEGIAAIQRGHGWEVEAHLAAAMREFEELAMAEEAAGCASLLRSILLAGGTAPPPVDDAGGLLAAVLDTWVTADELLNEDQEGAHAHIVAAAEALRPAEPAAAQLFAGMAALLRLDLGDAEPARRAVVDIERVLAEGHVPPMILRGLVNLRGWLAAESARVDGDLRGCLDRYAELERAVPGGADGLLAPLSALRRAGILHAAGRSADALEVGLPAFLALDAVRYLLPDARRRSRWLGRHVAEGLDICLRSAVAAGDHHVVAELIEVVRGNGVPVPRTDRADAVVALASLALPADPAAVRSTEPLAGAYLMTGAARTAIGLSARLRTPWHTVALGSALRAAERYGQPLRRDVTVDWRV